MGQKIHPTGFRLVVTRDWASRWFAPSKDFPRLLQQDAQVRGYLKNKLKHAAVRRIVIERHQEEQIKNFKIAAGIVTTVFLLIAFAFPWLLIAPVALLSQRRARQWMRAQATDWLDGVDQAAESAG